MNSPRSAVAPARSKRLFARLALLAALFAGAFSIAHDAFALTQKTAFGNKLNVPGTTPPGTVLSRYTIPKSDLCGAASTCKVLAVSLWENGGSALSEGPLIYTNVSGVSTQLLISGKPIKRTDFGTAGTPITISSSLEVQLVRDSRPLAPGSLSGQAGGNPSYYYLCLNAVHIPSTSCTSSSNGLAIALSAEVKLVDGTCSTPDQNITLPGVSTTQFKGVGSNGSAIAMQSFNLRFEKCPPGYARVGYTLTPIGGTGASNGTLPLRNESTATGVAIQVTDKSGSPATFDQSLKLDAYSTATGGTYTVPMVARYIQTGASILPGSVLGAMSVLVDYQ